MGILKPPATTKTKEGEPAPVHKHPPSPAISSISSISSIGSNNGSGSLLIPVPQKRETKEREKKKAASIAIKRRLSPERLKNILWLTIFLAIFLATVAVVAALTEGFHAVVHCPWRRSMQLYPFPTAPEVVEEDPPLAEGQEDADQQTCVHHRTLTHHGIPSSDIVHDFRSKWSAIVDHDERRCLIFDMHAADVQGCPSNYPWSMDEKVGVPVCIGPLAKIAPIRKVMHQIDSTPLENISFTGLIISNRCSQLNTFKVQKVVIHYFDRHLRRVARRSVDQIIEKNSVDHQMSIAEKATLVDKVDAMSEALGKILSGKAVKSPTARSDLAGKNTSRAGEKVNHSITVEKGSFGISKAGKEESSSVKKSGPGEGLMGDIKLDPSAGNRVWKALSASVAKKWWRGDGLFGKVKNHFRDRASPDDVGETRLLHKLLHAIDHGSLFGKHLSSFKREPSEDGKEGLWQVVYTAVDDQGNTFSASTIKELRSGIRRPPIPRLEEITNII